MSADLCRLRAEGVPSASLCISTGYVSRLVEAHQASCRQRSIVALVQVALMVLLSRPEG